MDFFHKMRLTTKIYLLVALLLLGMILSAYYSYIALNKFRTAEENFTQKILIGNQFQANLTNPAFGLWTPTRLSYMMASTHEQKEIQEYYQEVQNFKKFYKESLEWAKAHLAETDIKRKLLGPFDNSMQNYFDMWDTQFWPLMQAPEKNEAAILNMLNGPIKSAFNENKKINKEIADAEDTLQVSRVKEMEQDFLTAGESGIFSLWLSLLILGLGVLVSILVARSINARLKNIVDGISEVSKGIGSQIENQGASVSQLSTSVHETTTSMDELNASFAHTENLAGESSGRAKNALKHTEEGNSLTKQMLEGLVLHKDKMGAIVEQIARLSEITHQIHNVAAATSNLTNQTNILALNAAVQAAHVKQQTEGFSVIASEIRKLADESKKFLSHIDVLAENIKHATDTTMTLAEEGNKTLLESIKSAQSASRAFDAIMDINQGSFEGAEQVVLNVKQQVTAVHQVLDAMDNVNRVSQETKSGMNTMRNELNNLNSFSKNLKELV